ncbi:hypothetical protein CEXT_434081 [Caerostris extrusa]|uniref:Uncharacterized protein n=1 Tax=Caerostris extrusa TaxID=172846 RepID=A0AAV4TKW9_CAEEX|nr:hypothetical protein CEXT_434081 [Caerostris extrusa]
MITEQLPMLFRHFDDAHTQRHHKPLRQQLLKGERGLPVWKTTPTRVLVAPLQYSLVERHSVPPPSLEFLLIERFYRTIYFVPLLAFMKYTPWLLLLHGE